MPVEKQSGVSFPTPEPYLVFKIMNCFLWTCPKSLLPDSIQFIIINLSCGPCQGLLFFYCSCLLHVMTDISWVNNILFVFKVFHHFYFLLMILYANIWASQVVLVMNLLANTEDVREAGSIPVSRRAPEGGHSNSPQYSCWENPMDRGTWRATVRRVVKRWTWLKWLSTHAC